METITEPNKEKTKIEARRLLAEARIDGPHRISITGDWLRDSISLLKIIAEEEEE